MYGNFTKLLKDSNDCGRVLTTKIRGGNLYICVEIQEQIDQRIQDNRRISPDDITSEMNINN
jgi:hypothetical protein